MKTGIELIAAERQRQIEVEGWTAEHDDEHDDGSLLLAAVCYASPVRLYVREKFGDTIRFRDPWPESWDDQWDKRLDEDYELLDPTTFSKEQKIDFYKKAGAMIAAEIDRLGRV